MPKKIVYPFIIWSVFALQSTAKAYSYIDNKALFPMGETEEFMANTGIAMSGSSGAVYYNPAGLAAQTRNHISVSGNAYLSGQSSMSPVLNLDSTNMNFSTRSFQAVPTDFISTWKAGFWTIAFSVLVPHQLKVADTVSFSTPNYSNVQYSRTESFQLLTAGFSAAAPFQGGYDLGFGCHYAVYQTTQQENFDGAPSGGGVPNALIVNNFYDAEVDGILCNLGVQAQYSDKLRWGVTAHLPLISTRDTGRASLFTQNPQNGQAQTVGPESVSVEYAIPADLGFGVEYKYAPRWTGYADLNYQMGTSYNDGNINSETTKNNATPRLNLGVAYSYSDVTKIYGGLAYNPSSVSKSDGTASENFVIGTVGLYRSQGNSNFGIGFIYAQSSGTIQAPVLNAQAVESGVTSGSVSTTVTGLMINSGYVF